MVKRILEWFYNRDGDWYECGLKNTDTNEDFDTISAEILTNSVINRLTISDVCGCISFNKEQVEWLRDILNEIDLGDE